MKETEGRWSVKDAGTYFFATGHKIEVHPWNDSWLYAVNHLDEDASLIADKLDAGGRVLLDSGVFSLAAAYARTHKVTHDEALAVPVDQLDGFDALMAKWKKIVRANRDRLWGYIEIDLGGVEGKRRTRAGLEDEGFRPIPVIHPLNDGWDYFEEMADEYDRLCIGNIVSASGPVREDILRNVFERRQGKKVKWIHALGITPNPMWLAYPTESADSSSFYSPMAYGREMNEYSAFKSTWMPREVYTTENNRIFHKVMPIWAGLFDQHVRCHEGTYDEDRRSE